MTNKLNPVIAESDLSKIKNLKTSKAARFENINTISHLDGVEHINVDSVRGKTPLGKLLANFSRTPFTHPEYGPFASIEGFWYWIRMEQPDDALRSLHGGKARKYGKSLNNFIFINNFKEEIIKAILYKVLQNDNIFDLMVESTLPFKYYYLHGPHNIEITPDFAGWMCDGLEQIRTYIKEQGKKPTESFVYKEFKRAN